MSRRLIHAQSFWDLHDLDRPSRKTLKYVPAGVVAVAVGALLVKFEHFQVRTAGTHYSAPLDLHLTTTLRRDLVGGVISEAFYSGSGRH